MARGNGYGDGTFIEAKLFLSPAFLSLGKSGSSPVVSSVSLQVLILFLGKRKFGSRKNKKGQRVFERCDGNKISLTYKEMEARGISQKQFTRSIDELLAKGFISIVDPGGAYEKHKAVYALEENYRNWRPGDGPIRQRNRDLKRGYQNKNNGRRGRTPTRTSTTDTPVKDTGVNGGHPKK